MLQEKESLEDVLAFIINEIETEAHAAGLEIPYEDEMGELVYSIYTRCMDALGKAILIVD